ncbi:MAG: small acid-soluble spore protein SspI [Tepidanaerobacteraceae bacterium]|jgi:small acid-soluble spore protein I (minor)
MKGWDVMTALDLRNLVLKNLAGSSREEVEGYIQETIDAREEDALPGMGILFEVVWLKSSSENKSSMMDKIMEGINEQPIS